MYVRDADGSTKSVTVSGGYNIPAAGAPSPEVRKLPAPERLLIPTTTRRFSFTELRVQEGQRVSRGDALAVDPDSFYFPLLAPYAGKVRLSQAEGHVVLEDIDSSGGLSGEGDGRNPAGDRPAGASPAGAQGGLDSAKLVDLGVWQFLSDARTGAPVDPSEAPDLLVVQTPSFEPFVAGAAALLAKGTEPLARGIESLHSLFPGCSVCVAVPDGEDTLAADVRAAAERCGCARVFVVPPRYPFAAAALLARLAGMAHEPHLRIWALPLQGLLALERAASYSEPCTERVVSFAGPAVSEPMHLRVVPGYPIDAILEGRLCREPARVVVGGLLTGRTLPDGQLGLDSECEGLTVLAELDRRTFFGFARPGLTRRSYNRSFVGTYRPELAVRYSTGLGGELRPCIACGQCVDVCPARIMPNVIHKALYAKDIERAIDMRVDLCVECGLCSYLCPSKIDLRQQFIEAKAEIQADLEAAAALEAEA